MPNRIQVIAYLLYLVAHSAVGEVRSQPGSAMVAFATGDLIAAAGQTSPDIIVGTHAWLRAQGVSAVQPPGVAEAFAVSMPQAGQIVIAGHDEAGAMYGGLEVAEQIRLTGSRSVKAKTGKPFLSMRQYKYNLPGLKHGHEYFHTEEYWRSLLDLLARARFNSIGFWHPHPFQYMIEYGEFPEATVLSPEETKRNIRTFSMIFRLARERNVGSFIINWNIHLPSPLAAAHDMPKDGHDSPLVRAYMRYCIGQTLRTYPDLTGLGACAGERMPSPVYDWREQWVKETFIAGIRDSGRTVPLLHRYWWTAPDSVQRIIASDYAGQVILPLKYNGEHMYSGFRPHFLDSDWIDYPDYMKRLPRRSKKPVPDQPLVDHLEWINQKPRDYAIMWHLRNDCILTYRWGDPDFARNVLRNAQSDYSVGYLMGQERTRGGVARALTPGAAAKTQWQYEHEPHWFRFMLWGRLGYDPAIPDSHWQRVFERRFGAIGGDLYTAYVQTSKIIRTISRFHFNYMNGDWHPEWCDGGWNTGFGRGCNYRDRRPFHDVVEFVFNHTIEDKILDIPEFVGMRLRGEAIDDGLVTPDEVANQLTRASNAAREALARIQTTSPPERGEVWDCCQEFAATATLGLYYAEKIRGATELMFVFVGEEDRREAAVGLLAQAAGHWRMFAGRIAAHYRKGSTALRYVPRVGRDVLIAKHAGSSKSELAQLGVLKRASERKWFDFPVLRELVTTKLAGFVDPLNQLHCVEISPQTCDVLVLGREAWAFHELPVERKRLVVDAVERGVSLVLFFQNFPKFDTSWLPGGISGADADAQRFEWTESHAIAEGVDPAQLQGRAIVNDALVGGDEAWQCITKPYGGLCIRQHGKGTIVFCQLDMVGRYREPVAARLVRNIVAFANKGRRKPRICMLDTTTGSTIRAFDRLKIGYGWIDDLRLKQ